MLEWALGSHPGGKWNQPVQIFKLVCPSCFHYRIKHNYYLHNAIYGNVLIGTQESNFHLNPYDCSFDRWKHYDCKRKPLYACILKAIHLVIDAVLRA